MSRQQDSLLPLSELTCIAAVGYIEQQNTNAADTFFCHVPNHSTDEAATKKRKQMLTKEFCLVYTSAIVEVEKLEDLPQPFFIDRHLLPVIQPLPKRLLDHVPDLLGCLSLRVMPCLRKEHTQLQNRSSARFLRSPVITCHALPLK